MQTLNRYQEYLLTKYSLVRHNNGLSGKTESGINFFIFETDLDKAIADAVHFLEIRSTK